MEFEWDQHNLAKITAHSLTAALVEAIFSDPDLVTIEQPRYPEEEQRWKTTGKTAGRRAVAVWTYREDAIRVVTAWFESRPRRNP